LKRSDKGSVSGIVAATGPVAAFFALWLSPGAPKLFTVRDPQLGIGERMDDLFLPTIVTLYSIVSKRKH
jgi:hypothetical protein